MPAMDPVTMLHLWEDGSAAGAVGRALLLLDSSGLTPSDRPGAELSLGERDARLLALRHRLFGPDLEAAWRCPSCGGDLELNLPVDELAVQGGTPPQRIELQVAGYEIVCRPLTSRDLTHAAASPDLEALRLSLLEQALVGARRDGESVAAADLPAQVIEAIGEAIEAADPLARVELLLTCEICAEATAAPFDIASYLWGEIDAWARSLLREVHTLAAAYGWSQIEILALSPLRRRRYLEMVLDG